MKYSLLAGLAFLLAITAARAQSADQPIPIFRVSTRVVSVPLVATLADGTPVMNLSPSDIQVFDNGKRQTIASFEPMTPAQLSSQSGASQLTTITAAPAYPHYSILLFDALNTSWSDEVSARDAIEHLLDYFPSGQRIAILVLGDHLYLLHDFSSNPAELRAALQRFSMGPPHADVPISAAGTFSAASSTPNLSAFVNLAQSHTASSAREEEFYQRNRINQTLETLTAIAHMLQSTPGQKDLIWISAAFPLTLKSGNSELDNDSFYQPMQQTMRALSSASMRLYPIDARGLMTTLNAHVNIDTMQAMAEQTGGRAFYNSNGLATEMHRALEDSSSGYLLTYSPNDLRADGSFHKIRLRISRPGITLRYRPGYYDKLPSSPEKNGSGK